MSSRRNRPPPSRERRPQTLRRLQLRRSRQLTSSSNEIRASVPPLPLISIARRRVSHTPCNVRRKDSSKPLVVLGMLDSAGGRASSQSSYPRPADRESGAHLVHSESEFLESRATSRA